MDEFPVPARALLSSATDAILVVDAGGRIRWCNDATAKLFGYAPGALDDQPVEVLVPDDARGIHAARRHGYGLEPTPRPMGRGRRLRGQRADGSTFLLQIALTPVDIDGELHTAAVARDMTDWAATERQLELARQRQHLAEDRERIGRDLHDTVIQELFAAGMSLQGVVADARPERVAQRLSDTIDTIDTIIGQIRDTIFRLQQPPEATTRTESLHDLVLALTQSLGFTAELRIEGDPAALADEPAASVEIVIREALTNVARHAEASTARVEVRVGDELVVRISDDGVGLPDQLARRSGLANLSERATTLGGSLDLHRPVEGGTVLEWRVPSGASSAEPHH